MILDKPLRVRRLTATAVLPRYQSAGAAALDLVADEAVTLYPGERRVVQTGIAIELPEGYEAQVRGRSGLARKGFDVVLGTVDSDYRGGIGVICVNSWPRADRVPGPCAQCPHGEACHMREGQDRHSPRMKCMYCPCGRYEDKTRWAVAPGDRIAQLVIAPIARVSIVEAESLSETARGAQGFGSTGGGA